MHAPEPCGPRSGPVHESSRRAFLGAVAGAAVAAQGLCADPPAAPAPPSMPLRAFGRTGLKVSVFGLGCFPLGGLPDEAKGVEVVRHALARGCTYLDTAPSYANGASERRVGAAVKGRARGSYFLATKTHTRTARDARADLEGSLKRLGVERIDLVQVHAVGDEADLERALAADGPLAALAKAREEKLLRFVGVTGHMDPKVMRAAVERYDFDALLFPLNCVDPHHLSFVKETLPAAVAKGLARVAMKVLASGKLPTLGIEPADCLRYAYGLDVSTAVVGCSSPEHVDLAARIAVEDRRLTPAEEASLLERTRPHKGRGTEWYKRA
jgi:aryl-alcohol dehydrogenase-like predicted oxidoreductase